MINFAQPVAYYPDSQGEAGAPMVAFVERVIDDNTADLSVLRRGTLYNVPRCDPATPVAGCWSVLP